MKEVPFTGEDSKKISTDFDKKKIASGRIKNVRTYREDVAELIERKKITRTHIAIAEEERRRAIGESSVWEPQKTTSIIPLFLAGGFLLVGLSILFYDITGKSVPIFQNKKDTQKYLIANENTKIIGLSQFTREELLRSVRAIARSEKLAQGDSIRLGYRAQTGTTTLPLPLRTLFLSLDARVPDVLLRSLLSDYEGGLMSVGETKGYLVFTTNYYENSVVGLLSWEKQMVQDLYPIIDPLRAELLPTPSSGSWAAQTWNGYDIRVFTSADGRISLVYGWVDKKILIMTGSIQVFSELARLLTDLQR